MTYRPPFEGAPAAARASHLRATIRPAASAARLALVAALAPLVACLGGSEPPPSGQLGSELTGPGVGVDYSYARPSPASLVSDGYGFAVRYLSYETDGKNLTSTEADALIAAGLDVAVVWEQGGEDALTGYDLGVSEATAAASQAAACGQPATRPIYFAVDFEPTSDQMPAVEQYFAGVASVLGIARTGAYGGYGTISDLFDSGKITWGWQTYAWSSGEWDARAQLRQVENDVGPGGELDKDQSMVADFGQWGPGVSNTGPEACTVNGVLGTCIAPATCATMSGYVSTPGACPGEANVECCTPPAPPPPTCTVGGVSGTCIDTATCATMTGYVSAAGYCPGAADVECCTPAPMGMPPPSCSVSGVDGTCISTTTCASMSGYTSTAGHCPGAASIECCTPPPACTAGGVSGTCISTSSCAAKGATSTAGLCPGPADIECCTP